MKSLSNFCVFFILLLNTGFAASAESKPIEIKTPSLHMIFTTSPISSLVYQIDCMAEVIHCEGKTIHDFWKTKTWSEQDEQALKKWAALLGRYQENQFKIDEISPDAAKDAGFPIRNSSISFDQKFRMASFISKDLNSYRDSLSLLMQTPDVEQVLDVIKQFSRRHQIWWKKEGERKTKAFSLEFVQVMKKKNLTTFLPQVASFYQAQSSAQTPVYFHFFLLPGKTNQTSGEQIENHSVVEVPDGEVAEDRVDVILHELSHYFYHLAPIEKHLQIVKSFAASSDVSSIAAYNLLNEVVATAIGNGLVNQKVMTAERFKKALAKENSFYNDKAIDQVAKAMMPKIESMISQGRNLYESEFITDYKQVVQTVLGDMALAPKLSLRTMRVLYQDEFKKDFERFARNIRSGAYWNTTDFKSGEAKTLFADHPHLSGVIAIKPDSLSLLDSYDALIPAAELKKMKSFSAKKAPFIHPVQRTANSWIYVLIANPGDEAAAMFSKLEKATKPADFL